MKEGKAYKYAVWCSTEQEGKVPEYVKKQAESWLHIADGNDEDAYVDEQEYEKICKLLKLMVHPDLRCSIYDGLEDYAWFMIVAGLCTYCRNSEQRSRFYVTILLEIARKNFKTFNSAVIFILLMLTEPDFSRFFSVAPDLQLSSELKNAIRKIIKVSPALYDEDEPAFKVLRSQIICLLNENEYTPLAYSQDGMDAAWCCMFIWACFNKSGHADLFMGGAKEAYCFNVRDYYQARGKWGSTPKKGALVIYGGQGHIGIVESVNSAGGYTSIEGNYGDDVKRRDSHQNVLGFCYIDYPVTKSAEGSDEVISGTTVAVPGSVAQTGIIKDYTNYSYFFGRWNSGSTQKIIADLWENNGKQGKNGIATINGYYLIALRPVFGSAGDVVSVVLEDGARFNAIIADEKGDDAGNQWGHVYSGAVSIVEFESLGNSETNNGAQLNIGQWAGKKVTAIINGGRYSGL